MKILITGAYGFVGTNLCRYLTGRGHVCDALDIPAAKREGVPYAAFFRWEDVDSTSAPIPFASYDAVVHLAGKAHDLKKVASEQSYFDINVGLTQRIFGAFRKEVEKVGGQRTFVFFSSSKADPNGNAYGRSKFAAEEYLKEANTPLSASTSTSISTSTSTSISTSTSTSSLHLSILRPAMIHGPGNKGNLNLLWGLARRGLPWPLASFENKRSFTSIGNICAAVEALCAHGVSGVYPIADDEMLSTNRLIELIAEACGRKAKLWRLPKGLMKFAASVGDVLHLPLDTERLGKLTEDSFVDNAALKRSLGWAKMPVAAEDGMRATLRNLRPAASQSDRNRLVLLVPHKDDRLHPFWR